MVEVPKCSHFPKRGSKRNQNERFLLLTNLTRLKMITYSGFICLMSFILYPSYSSTSIIEDVSTSSDVLDAADGIFTSNNDLQSLLSTEEAIMYELQEYVKNEEKRLEKLKG